MAASLVVGGRYLGRAAAIAVLPEPSRGNELPGSIQGERGSPDGLPSVMPLRTDGAAT